MQKTQKRANFFAWYEGTLLWGSVGVNMLNHGFHCVSHEWVLAFNGTTSAKNGKLII